MRKVQVLVFAKFMSDSAWYFYLFWLPKYLYDVRGFDVKHVSYYAWIPYAASGIGSFLGGWLSSALLKRDDRWISRESLFLVSAHYSCLWSCWFHTYRLAGHLCCSALRFSVSSPGPGLIMTLPADIFPLSAVGSVAGLIGFGGAIGGAIFGVVAGFLLGHGFGYGTLFFIVGTFHLIGFLAILLLGGKMHPLKTPELTNEIESQS